MDNKPILAFDCSALGASVTVMAAEKFYTARLGQGKQAIALVPTIDTLMREAGVAYAELGTIITTVGPGSFTGLRIGLATLHGFVLVHHTPIKLLTSHEAMAWSVFAKPGAPLRITTVLKAGKGEVSAQEFTSSDGKPAAMGKITLFPETHTEWPSPDYGNHLQESDADYLPDADSENLCRIVSHLPESTLAEALPLYIRPPDALIPKTPGLARIVNTFVPFRGVLIKTTGGSQ